MRAFCLQIFLFGILHTFGPQTYHAHPHLQGRVMHEETTKTEKRVVERSSLSSNKNLKCIGMLKSVLVNAGHFFDVVLIEKIARMIKIVSNK